ncbi:hypothetical protein FA15DRAFT_663326 [Coprinopsis marcescibilis]|uniref:Mediator complex subunit 16 n=1 Tax=Coprinopsis marcescibilis TaxID=230819 RepID=A0A5C3LAD0_COPMA|nr:hypothetical protein FA15DRAFT_663326 [Coprinopsis marcescibilis]
MASPSKGKGRESTRTAYETGWWDTIPFTEPKRSVQWSSSSVLFASDKGRPFVLGRHSNKSTHFVVPPPSAPEGRSHKPPTCILVSPNDEYLFAVFPAAGDGSSTGCIWKHNGYLEGWRVLKTWLIPAGAGVVTGQWLGSPRQWAFGPSQLPIRLPPQGPRIPQAELALLLITEDHCASLIYAPQFLDTKIVQISISLLHPGTVTENQRSVADGKSNRVCVEAALGFHFSEPRIFVAHRSRSFPSHNPPSPQEDEFSFNSEADSTSVATDWDYYGEESKIMVSMLDISIKNASVVLTSSQLPPLRRIQGHITQMTFMSYPSEQDSAGKENLFLSVSTMDLGNYDSNNMKSSLNLYALTRRPPGDSSPGPVWSCSHRNTTSFDGTLAFTVPMIQPAQITEGVAIIGVLDASGEVSRDQSRTKDTLVGKMRVINIPSLTDNNQWEQSPIWSSVYSQGLPHSGVVSPNKKQLWATSFALYSHQSSIHALPQALQGKNNYLPNAIDLALAILSKRAAGDIVHLFSQSNISLEEVVESFTQGLQILKDSRIGATTPVVHELCGVALELYRTRALQARTEQERKDCDSRWRVGQDMASLAACKAAFEDVSEGYRYDPLSLVPLTKLCSWILDFFKTMLKQCVLASTNDTDTLGKEDGNDLFETPVDSEDTDDLSTLVHLSHPIPLEVLRSLVEHIRNFRNDMENSLLEQTVDPTEKMLRNVLFDVIDYCPINLGELEIFLQEASRELVKLPETPQNETLMACKPNLALAQYWHDIVKKVALNSKLTDKVHLFIQPQDLVDGLSRLSVTAPAKGNDLDIITKDVLKDYKVICVRCGGRHDSELRNAGRWPFFEKRWKTRCVCGGVWSLRHHVR